MAKKKAKWLEEATNQELLVVIQEGLNNLDDEKAVTKAAKAVEELIARQPVETDGTISVEEALTLLKEKVEEAIGTVEQSYKAELAAMDEDSDEEEDSEEEEEEDSEEEEDEDTPDYQEMSQRELKEMCRDRGIKVKKGMKKSDYIKLLEADDKE